jgi:biopolymer transport protein ExbB
VQKLLFLKTNFMSVKSTLNSVKDSLTAYGKRETLVHFRGEKSMVIQVLLRAVKLSDRSPDQLDEAVRQSVSREIPRLERLMPMISSIITAAPIIGLTGTVIGLMDIFNVISGAGLGDTQALSAGIAVALITTVTGLCITLPLIFIYQYLNQKIEHSTLELEQLSYDIIDFCRSNEAIKA